MVSFSRALASKRQPLTDNQANAIEYSYHVLNLDQMDYSFSLSVQSE
jgi:hypothetical protein